MRIRHSVLLLSLACLGATAAPQVDDDRLVVITAPYSDRAQLQRIASRFQHLIVDQRRKTIRVEATHDELVALRRDGIDARIDDTATQRLRVSEASLRQDFTIQSISGYPCYRTVDETYATMNQLVQARPALARIVDIGPTWLESRQAGAGKRMRVLRLTNSATDSMYRDKADMVVVASIHAREYTPAELLSRFAESLVNGYGVDNESTWLLDNFRFHLVLQGNPDGREKAEAGLSWRKNVDNSNGTCSATTYGIDLNRNFPFAWNTVPGGSSGNACATNYRGPQRMSEPESRNLMQYVAGTPDTNGVYSGGVFPDRRGSTANSVAPGNYQGMFVDLHSYSQMVLWPWAYSTAQTSNGAAFRTLGRRLAWFNNYRPQQWINLYAADGTTTDTMYGQLGVPSYTIELGVAFFETCSTFEGTTLPRNLSALRYAARNLAAPYRYPAGPDTTAIGLSATSVTRGTPVTVTATVDDTRFNQSNGAEATQSITGARAFVDQRPWRAGINFTTMRASDGAFNSTREVVTITIPTSGLSRGRHFVSVQGTDASARVGTPNAAYFVVQ